MLQHLLVVKRFGRVILPLSRTPAPLLHAFERDPLAHELVEEHAVRVNVHREAVVTVEELLGFREAEVRNPGEKTIVEENVARLEIANAVRRKLEVAPPDRDRNQSS
jgi:hypothetical protein